MPNSLATDTMRLHDSSLDRTDMITLARHPRVYPGQTPGREPLPGAWLRSDLDAPDDVETTPRRALSSPEIARLGTKAAWLRRIREAPPPAAPMSVHVTKRWVGVVRSVEPRDYFEAELMPLDDGSGPAVTADLTFDAVSDDDARLIYPGTSFYLHVGRTSLGPGRTIAFTSIKVRRLGRWRDEELEFLRERARKRRAGIDFE